MLAKEIDGTAFRLIGTGVSALREDRWPTTPTCSTAARPMPNARSMICGKSSAMPPSIRGIAYKGPAKEEDEEE